MGDTRATVIIFYGNRVDDIRMQGDVINTLQARMGTGGGNMPMACYPIQGSQIGRDDKNGPQGSGVGKEDGPMFTVNTTDRHAVSFYSTDGGFGAKDDNLAPSTKVGGVTAMATISVVRRLTPTECERLQGFPDGWTEGQADSHRYKQMGNAVAVPVVEWIMERLVEHDRV